MVVSRRGGGGGRRRLLLLGDEKYPSFQIKGGNTRTGGTPRFNDKYRVVGGADFTDEWVKRIEGEQQTRGCNGRVVIITFSQ